MRKVQQQKNATGKSEDTRPDVFLEGELAMKFFDTHKYDDIINRSRPASKHPHMSRADRAKIFSPFAALKGYEEAVKNKEKLRVDRVELSDDEKAIVNKKLFLLKKGQTITVVYFHWDSGADGSGGTGEGEYITLSGIIEKIDTVFRILTINGVKINFDDISDIFY